MVALDQIIANWNHSYRLKKLMKSLVGSHRDKHGVPFEMFKVVGVKGGCPPAGMCCPAAWLLGRGQSPVMPPGHQFLPEFLPLLCPVFISVNSDGFPRLARGDVHQRPTGLMAEAFCDSPARNSKCLYFSAHHLKTLWLGRNPSKPVKSSYSCIE